MSTFSSFCDCASFKHKKMHLYLRSKTGKWGWFIIYIYIICSTPLTNKCFRDLFSHYIRVGSCVKLLGEWQTVYTLIRRRYLRRLIWIYTVCSGLSVRIRRVSTVIGLNWPNCSQRGIQYAYNFLCFFKHVLPFNLSILTRGRPAPFFYYQLSNQAPVI